VLDNISGAVNINGASADTVNLDDTAAPQTKSRRLQRQTSQAESRNHQLQSPGQSEPESRHRRPDLYHYRTDPGTVTSVASASGNDTFNIRTVANTTSINAGSGTNTFNVGSLAPATGSVIDGIAAASI